MGSLGGRGGGGCEQEGSPLATPNMGRWATQPRQLQLPHGRGWGAVMDIPVGHCSPQKDAAGGQMALHTTPALHVPPSHPGVNKGLNCRVTLSWLVLWGWEQGGSLQSGASTVWGRKAGQELPVEHSPGGCSLPPGRNCAVPPPPLPNSSRPCCAPAKGTDALSLSLLPPGSVSIPGSGRLGQELGSLPAASRALRPTPH